MSKLSLCFGFVIGEEIGRLRISIILLIVEVCIGEDGREECIAVIDHREWDFVSDEDDSSQGRGLSL